MKIHEVVARCRRLTLPEQVAFLRSELRKSPLRSTRYNEIQSLLQGKLTKQLKREIAA